MSEIHKRNTIKVNPNKYLIMFKCGLGSNGNTEQRLERKVMNLCSKVLIVQKGIKHID